MTISGAIGEVVLEAVPVLSSVYGATSLSLSTGVQRVPVGIAA